MTDTNWNIALTTPDAVVRDYPDILQRLADLEYAAVVIRGFYDLDDCAEVVRRIEADTTGLVDVKEYATTGGDKLELRYIGPGLGRYVRDREGFFRESRLSDEKFERLYDALPDARVMVRDMIGRLLPDREVIVPDEEGERYSDAVVRIAKEGDSAALHRDSAMEYFKGWMVSQFPTQFSSLVCFQWPESGGELFVYKKRWQPEHDEMKVEGATGYPPSVVEGAPVCKITPQEGDLYIFHPEIFHDIAPMYGPRNRITQGIFFAMSDTDKRVVTWG
jgi:hypothetical protein